MDHVRDVGGLNAVMARRELVVVVLELGIEYLPSPLSISLDALDLCKVLPLVEASHSIMERVVFGRGPVDEVGEPGREQLDRL
jgi:hypothetical protein